MQYQVELHGTDGTGFTGGNALDTLFVCGDEFIQNAIARCGGTLDSLEWVLDEAAKDISGELYMDVDRSDEDAQECGYADATEEWESKHGDDWVYRYTSDEDGWSIEVSTAWGMQDTLALTAGEAIVPELRKVFIKHLLAREPRVAELQEQLNQAYEDVSDAGRQGDYETEIEHAANIQVLRWMIRYAKSQALASAAIA